MFLKIDAKKKNIQIMKVRKLFENRFDDEIFFKSLVTSIILWKWMDTVSEHFKNAV